MANELYLKDKFEKWMTQQTKSNGLPYSMNTINSYVTFIKNGVTKFRNANIEHQDLFNYTDLNTFKQVYEKITQEPDFDEVDLACGNRAFSCGVKLYMNFLENCENDTCENICADTTKLDEHIEFLKSKALFFSNIASISSELYKEINNLSSNKKQLDTLSKFYETSTGPLNILRYTVLRAIAQGVTITEDLVQEIKNKFNEKDTKYFSKYIDNTMIEHILSYKAKNGGNPFHSWKDPFRIFYVYFFNGEIKATTKSYLNNIGMALIKKLELSDYTTRIVDFDGCQNQGQQITWISLYPSRLKNYNNAVQIFCEINQKELIAGIYKGSKVKKDIVLDEKTRKNTYNNFDEMLIGLSKQIDYAINLNNSISEFDIEEDHINYWMYSAGENSKHWEQFYNEGIIGIGWNGLGDLSNYKSKSEIKEKLIEENPQTSNRNNALANWQFANELKVGDIVYVKRGNSSIIGRGIIESDYIYENDREPYKSIRKINWTNNGKWNSPANSDNVVKTLTNITPYTDYVNQLEELFGLTTDDNISETFPQYTECNFIKEVFMDKSKYEKLKNLLLNKKNIILQGAPGVGKTFVAKRLAYSILGEKDTSKVKMIQFHQSYGYEDFIMGYRPSENGFTLKNGPFYDFCKKAEEDSENKYFFIIDEINRGKLSKILGELLMLIETDKRGLSLQLLYKNEQFSVPKNLYIIGMMNTADRSLAMIDYALRRRFAFFEFEPAFKTQSFIEYKTDKNNEKYNKLIDEIISLNNEIANDPCLGDGFQIGHSYFCTNKEADDEWLNSVIEYEIAPLLKEYWFDEPEKYISWITKLKAQIN